jgi:Mrp family chromosome partitioning ATPase
MNASTALRTLTAAVTPRSSGELARLRRGQTQLAGRSPRPMVVVVLGFTPRAGTSTLAALIARLLAALAPGRVAMLDGDGVQQSQRVVLGADDSGDLRALLAAPQAWRSRRAIDRYLAQASVPLLTMARDRSWSVPLDHIDQAVKLMRRRFPVVIVDLPLVSEVHYEWTARAADHVILVGNQGADLDSAQDWLTSHRDRGTHIVAADATIPRDPELRRSAPVRLEHLRWATLAEIEEIVARLLDESGDR